MTGSEYDFWLLDLDGTLIDVEHWYIYEVFDRVGSRLQTTFTDEEAKALWYGYGDERAAILDDRGVDRDRFWDIFHEEERPQARAGATHLYEDAEAFVPALSEPVGLVTHCQEYLTGPVLDHLDIADWFDTVVCCTDETGWKPDPNPVHMAMSDLGVAHNGHEGVLAGDDPNDIGAAHNAGIESVHVERIKTPESDDIRPDHSVTSLTDLV
jgi:phosphoglycolate phosphatase